MQERKQHDDRECSADENVLLHDADGGSNVFGFVVVLKQFKVQTFQHAIVKFLGDSSNSVHDFEHVGVRSTSHAEAIAGDSVASRKALLFLVGEFHFCHVGNVNRRAVFNRQDLACDIFGVTELTDRSNNPAAFAFPDVARRGVFVLSAECIANVADGELSRREAFRIDDHLKFFFLTAVSIGFGDARDSLELRFDHVL